jgi:AsmA protein
MNVRDSMRAHPWRWISATVIVLILLAVLAGVLIVRSLLQPQRFTALLQSRLSDAGLILSVDKPASPALWPHPAVQLQGFRLSVAGSPAPLLSASEARIVVPWRALLHRELAIERLEIENPRIDIEQLQALLSRMPHKAGAPQLPRIGAGLRIVNGTLVRGDQPLLFDINAETGPLVPGTPFHLDASARNGADRGGKLSLRMLPRHKDNMLLFEDIDLRMSVEQGTQAHFTGNASWAGGSELGATLHGGFTLPAHGSVAVASTPPSGSSPASAASVRNYTLALQVQPAQDTKPMIAALKLQGEGKHVDMRVQPAALMAWWHTVLDAAPRTALAMPPMSGQAQLDSMDIGRLHVQGLRLEAGPQVMPLSAGSAPPSASSKAGGKTN